MFYVCQESLEILGRDACEDLGLVKRVDKAVKGHKSKEDILEEHKDVFQGLGKYEKEYDIELKEDTVPVIQPTHTIPYARRDKLKTLLDKLEEANVIASVEKPTDWVNNLVIADKKDGSLRVCLDPKPLNQAIKRQRYIIPTPTDVRSRLAGKKVFTVIDMKDAY